MTNYPIIRTLETLCGLCIFVCITNMLGAIAVGFIVCGDAQPAMRLPLLFLSIIGGLGMTFWWVVLYAVLKSLSVGLTLLASIAKNASTSAQNSFVLASRE
jgi:hypothetical protein